MESDIRDVLELVANEKSPLVIFVDDLDRCVPHKVAEVVEVANKDVIEEGKATLRNGRRSSTLQRRSATSVIRRSV